MTAIILTLTAEAVWLSSDSFLSEISADRAAGISATVLALRREDIVSAPHPDNIKLTCAGHRNKLWYLPECKLAMGWAGFMEPAERFRWECMVRDWRDLDELVDAAPDLLNEVLASVQSVWRGLLTVIVGWSPRAGRCVGHLFRSSEGCQPEKLPDGHLFQPIWPADDPMARLHADAAPDAARGIATDEFHRSTARTLARCSRRGLYPTSGIGGQLYTVKITEQDFFFRTNGSLDA